MNRETVSNPTRDHLNMTARFLRFTKTDFQEFSLRDSTVLLRMKGRVLANRMPGIGAVFRWLEKRTDDYEPKP